MSSLSARPSDSLPKLQLVGISKAERISNCAYFWLSSQLYLKELNLFVGRCLSPNNSSENENLPSDKPRAEVVGQFEWIHNFQPPFIRRDHLFSCANSIPNISSFLTWDCLHFYHTLQITFVHFLIRIFSTLSFHQSEYK